MGLRTSFEEPTTVEFTTAEGDEVQLMAPGDPYYEFFSTPCGGPRAPVRGRRRPRGRAPARGGRRRDRRATRTRQPVGMDPLSRAGRKPVRARQPAVDG